METYTITLEDFTKNANAIKETLLLALERDGLLKKKAEEIAASYVVVVSKRGWFGTLFKRLSGGDTKENNLLVDVLKVV